MTCFPTGSILLLILFQTRHLTAFVPLHASTQRHGLCPTPSVPSEGDDRIVTNDQLLDWGLWSEGADEGVADIDDDYEIEDERDERTMLIDSDDATADALRGYTIAAENLQQLPNAPDVAYFYLQNELGMLPEDMCKITHEAGSALGLKSATLRKKVDLLRETMNLTDEDIRVIIRLSPTVLHLSADKNLAPTILFLQRELDLSRKELKNLVLQRPYVLNYSIQNLRGKIKFFTKVMSFTVDETRELLLKEPQLLSAGVEGGLFPRMKFLVQEIEITLSELRPLVQKNPLLLLYSVEYNLQPKLVFFFIMTLYIDTTGVKKLLKRHPCVVNYNLDNHILPIARFLMTEVEFSPWELGKIIIKFPRLLNWSLKKIKYVVWYLRFELGMDPDQVRRILYQAPQVISLSTQDNVKPKVAYLLDLFHGETEHLRKVIAWMPTLLNCSLEKNLKPKVDYLTSVLGEEETRMCIQSQPSLLGFSLDKRIRPRIEMIQEAGGHPRAITGVITRSDADFQMWMNGKRRRLRQEPGYDKFRRVRNEDGILLPERYENEVDEDRGDGRIKHWNQERKPPSQR